MVPILVMHQSEGEVENREKLNSDKQLFLQGRPRLEQPLFSLDQVHSQSGVTHLILTFQREMSRE